MMIVLAPVSAPSLYSYSYHFDPYVARQRAEQRARTEACIRRHHQEQLRKQLILDSLRAQEYSEYDNNPLYNYDYNLLCPAFDYDAAIQQARRQAVLEKAARLAALKARREEQELHARRRANAERFLSMLLDPKPQAQPEIFTQPMASTSKVTVQDQPSPKHTLRDHPLAAHEPNVCDALRSVFTSISGGNSTETSAAADHSTLEQETEIPAPAPAPAPSEGKGKGKELPQLDSEEEPSPIQVSSSLSQISAIASRLETLLSNFQFPSELDFSPERSPSPSYSVLDTDAEFALTYTPMNAPLREQEHALSSLLSELDGVPSFGSHVVRDARRTVVMRVEQALEALEKCVEERRGRARAKKADSATVTQSVRIQDAQTSFENSEPVEVTVHSMDVDADVSPLEPESVDLTSTLDSYEVPTNVFSESVNVPITDGFTEDLARVSIETAPMESYDATESHSSQADVDAPTSASVSIRLSSASVTEPNVASSTSFSPTHTSLPIAQVAEASGLENKPSAELEELAVEAVPPVSEKIENEGMVVVEQANSTHSTTQMEVKPLSYTPHSEVDADLLPKNIVPLPGLGSVSTTTPDSVPVYPMEATDVPTYSAIELPSHSSPSSEQGVGTSPLPMSRPASPSLVPPNSEDGEGVVVDYEHENEDDWSHVNFEG